MKKTPGLFPTSIGWNHPIKEIDDIDMLPHMFQHKWFASLSIGALNLVSRYGNPNTRDDIFVANTENGGKKWCRFVAVVVSGNDLSVRVETIKELPSDSRYTSLERCARTLDGTDFYFAIEVVTHLRTYNGMTEGVLSGERDVVDVGCLVGMAAYAIIESRLVILQASGCPVHN
uniref:Uncharacterized protein n=1 Tax=Caenorhabditis japonica TaxID=281687 RepID=A0A8R1HLU5_CAEJA